MLYQSRILGLQKGIKLFCGANPETKSPRIWLSSGTTQEIEQVSDDIRYRPGAFVPKEPWREPSLTEYSLLCANERLSNLSSWELGSCIGVCRLPDEVLAPMEAILEELGTRSEKTLNEYKTVSTHLHWESALAELIKYLQLYCRSSGEPEVISPQAAKVGLQTVTKVISFQVTQPGLKTVTKDNSINRSKSLFVGMHLDSWDRAPLRRRHKSRNRVCVNFGCEDRYFLFINLTLMDMFKTLGFSDEEVYKHYRGTDLGDEFMKRYPSYPVVKLKVAPKEAYIAPTDNLIHDASSIGKTYPDISLTFLGYFRTPSQVEEEVPR